MARTAYFSILGIAKQAKALYVGVDGVARTVKRGFVGVEDIARQFWGDKVYSGTLTRTEATTIGTNTLCGVAGAHVDDYCLLGGGAAGSSNYSTVRIYDSNVVELSTTTLARGGIANATDNGQTAVFISGYSSSDTSYNAATSFDSNLVKTTLSTPSMIARGNYTGSATTNGYFTFMESYMSSSGTKITYSTSDLTYTSVRLPSMGAIAAIGNYLILGGGYNSSSYPCGKTTVRALSDNGTTTTLTALSYSMWYGQGFSTASAAIIGGGYDKTANKTYTNRTMASAFNSNLTKVTCSSITGNYASSVNNMHGCGILVGTAKHTYTTSTTAYWDYYTASTMVTIHTANLVSKIAHLSQARYLVGASYAGDYMLVYGGTSETSTNVATLYNTLDIFAMS